LAKHKSAPDALDPPLALTELLKDVPGFRRGACAGRHRHRGTDAGERDSLIGDELLIVDVDSGSGTRDVFPRNPPNLGTAPRWMGGRTFGPPPMGTCVRGGAPERDAPPQAQRGDRRARVADQCGDRSLRTGARLAHRPGPRAIASARRQNSGSSCGASCFLRLMTPGRSITPSAFGCPSACSIRLSSPQTSSDELFATMSVIISANVT
jgi:hypothetical protein